MQQQIEKLKQEREKLTTEFQNSRTEYKFEIKRIDRAIRNFEKGINELSSVTNKPKRQKSSSVVEEILLESGPLHLKVLCEKLNERGIPMAYQSLSGLMQTYAKSGKKFTKTAPATYGLLENSEADIQEETSSTTEGEKETIAEPGNSSELQITYDMETNTVISGEENE